MSSPDQRSFLRRRPKGGRGLVDGGEGRRRERPNGGKGEGIVCKGFEVCVCLGQVNREEGIDRDCNMNSHP